MDVEKRKLSRTFVASMIRRVMVFLLVFIFIIFSAFAKELNILHLNDFHGRIVPEVQKLYKQANYQVAGAEYIYSIIDNLRKNNSNVLLFDAGDFSAGTIYSNLSSGMAVVDFYNKLKFDAVVIGNHEFDFGYDNFRKIVMNLSTNVLCANANPLFDNTKPFVILDKYGLRIAVIGLLTPETKMITFPNALGGRDIIDPVETLLNYRSEIMKYSPDLVIVLSHCGVDMDKKIAQNVDYIDLIIGGHSHTELFESVVVENNNKKIYIVQAGSYGKYIGHIKLDVENKKINNFQYWLYPTINSIIKPDRSILNSIGKYIDDAKKYAQITIGVSEITMEKNSNDPNSNLGLFITNVLAYVTNSDIAFYNKGGIRDVLRKGNITYGQIFNILPFENQVVKFEMRGKDIVELLENMDKKKTALVFNSALEKRDGKWFFNSEPIDYDRFYTVSTVDFLYYGGDGYTEFSSYKVIANYGYARELLVEYIKKNSPLKSANIELIKIK